MKRDFKTLWEMFLVFFRIGAFTIGGGLAMIPIIEREVVHKNKWVSEEEIVDVIAVTQSLPGVIAINSSIFVGYKVGGVSGSIAAALGVIMPSFIIILLIAILLGGMSNNVYLDKAFAGVRAGVTALILLSCIKLGKASIKNKFGLTLGILAFIAIVLFELNAVYAIIAGALIGYIYNGIWKVKNQ